MLSHVGTRHFAAAHFRALGLVANDVQPNPLPNFAVGGVAGSFIGRARTRQRLQALIECSSSLSADLHLRDIETPLDAAAAKRAEVIRHNNAFLLLAA